MLFPSINVYLKRHMITGKLYFGKTSLTDVEKYKGSGTYWGRHCDIHGWDHIENVFIYNFTDDEELVEFCLAFSEIFDIVKSDKFANSVAEFGLTRYTIIDIYGNKLYVPNLPQSTNNFTDEYVNLKSKEGRIRSKKPGKHKNSGTASIYDTLTQTVYRASKEIISKNPDRYISVYKNEFRDFLNKPKLDKSNNKQVQAVSKDGIKYSVTKMEYATGNHISTNSIEGKHILSINISGNKKDVVTCRDITGKIITITKIEYWKQLEDFGEDRNKWPFVHPTHPVGKNRKSLICRH